MNHNKVLLISVVVVAVLCCVSSVYSIKCYSCENVRDCKSPRKVECNPFLANQTSSYLDVNHMGVNKNFTSPYYYCISDYLKVSSGEFRYKGCLYSNIDGCNLPLRPYHSSNKVESRCFKCNNKDLCNPAGRAGINAMTVLSTIMAVGLIGKYARSFY